MADGGYDNGYGACPCFWGREPGSLVVELLKMVPSMAGMCVLDAGCGEGKNAYAMAQRGANVLAIDCSERALANGRAAFPSPNIVWCCEDIQNAELGRQAFDVVVAYGIFHCLCNETQVGALVERLKIATRLGGYNLVCTFNSRSQDLSGHPNFKPCLLDHQHYLSLYHPWNLVNASDTDLREIHPDNGIPHAHSLTRFIAQRTK